MGIPTKDRLAAELRAVADKAQPANAVIYRALADRAETGEFDDYGDVHVCGPTALFIELSRAGLTKFAARVAAGEFDASREESEAWARSQTDPEVMRIMDAMGIGPDRSKDNWPMPRTETHLNETDIKLALAFWVDAGCPENGLNPSRVSLSCSKALGNDPREHDSYSAVIRPAPRVQTKD